MKSKLYSLLTFCGFSLTALSQSPGGVSGNLTMWVRANSGVTTTGALVNSWQYVNDGTKFFTGTGASRPTLATSTINFQPAIVFNDVHELVGPTGALAPITAGNDSYAIFGVWNTNSNKNLQRVWSQTDVATSGSGTSLWMYSNMGATPLYGNQAEIGPFVQGIAAPYPMNGRWNVSQINLLAQNSNDVEIIDNRNISTTPAIAFSDNANANGQGLRNISTLTNIIGQRSPGVAGGEGFVGNLSELIVFDRPISGAERNQVFSYLALKYGITLHTNLVTSGGAVTVWNTTTNTGYDNDVFGLGQDDGSGLLVTQSNSEASGLGNGTGRTAAENVVINSASGLADGEFLLVGHNNAAVGTVQNDAFVPTTLAGSSRLSRLWKVQHTGDVGTVTVAFDLNGLGISTANANSFRLIIDADGDGDFQTGTQRYATPTIAGSIVTFTGVQLNNGEVFSLITNVVGSALPVTWKSFSATEVNGKALLKWEVGDVEKSKHYEIQYSTNSTDFSTVGVVAQNGPATSFSYTYPGELAPGANYFRIRQVDLDGQYIFSRIAELQIKGELSLNLINTIVSSNALNIRVKTPNDLQLNLEVWTNAGYKVFSKQQTISNGLNNIQLDVSSLPKGNYILQMRTGSQTQSAKFIKQ
ncbi:MAG: T9SS type A sorting domain-containing protein [Chitinophagaceae bacterium]|nr:T9SS type A sorting domain-containing protein [Chitinophagaceae bacterium]